MPIYLFKCGSCSKINEYLMRRDETSPDSCAGCSSSNGPFTRVYDGQTFSAITRDDARGKSSPLEALSAVPCIVITIAKIDH